jgi:hypothetical protein
MSGRGRSDTYVIADSKPWKAGCGVETDLEQRLEGTLWLEGGLRLRGGHMGWEWTCTVEMREMLLVVKRQEGGDEIKRERRERVEYKEDERVVELLKEGSDRPRRCSSLFY